MKSKESKYLFFNNLKNYILYNQFSTTYDRVMIIFGISEFL